MHKHLAVLFIKKLYVQINVYKINDMPQAVDCDVFLYAVDACLLFEHKDLEQIKEELTKNFSNICMTGL